MNLGSTISTVAQSIALGIDAIWGSDLATCSECGKMARNLDAGMSIKDAIIERWFKEEGENMQFQIQIIVEAEGVAQAIAPEAIAKGTIIGVTPRPTQNRTQLPTQLTNMKTGQPVGGE